MGGVGPETQTQGSEDELVRELSACYEDRVLEMRFGMMIIIMRSGTGSGTGRERA
jgi:hypothetical protein